MLATLDQSCICCGGKNLHKVEKELFICDQCQHLWRLIKEDSLKAHYSELSGRNAMPVKYTEAKLAERIEFLKRYIKEPCTILEIGCAEGEMGARLKSICDISYFGIEISFDAKQAAEKLDAVYADILDIDQTAMFDLILGFHVLEHVADINDAVQAWVACLKPEGRVIIEVPNHAGHPLLNIDHNPEHIHQFDIVSLVSLLRNHGLDIEWLSTGLFESPCYSDSIRVVAKRLESAELKQQRMADLIQKKIGRQFDVFGIGGDFYNYVYPLCDILKPVCFFDSAAQGRQVNDIDIISFSPEINNSRPILITTVRYEYEVSQELLNQGIQPQKIFFLSDVLTWIAGRDD